MVQFRDLIQSGTLKDPPASIPAPAATPSLPAHSSPISPTSNEAPRPRDHFTLYAELTATCQRCLQDAEQEQRITLGALPSLLESLVERMGHEGAELLRLSTANDRGFSLASHGVNVAILSVRVGMELGLNAAELRALALAGLLHDVGMTKVRALLHVPASLDPAQRVQVHQHPLLGQRLLERCDDIPPAVRDVIVQEHERYDGSGYPRQLAGSRIHEYAQIVGLMDTYEAMVHDRPYRKRRVPSDALRTLIDEQRAQFRQDLLKALLRAIPIYPVDSWVRLNTGELARVIATSPRAPLAPTVTVLLDARGQTRPDALPVNLATEPQLKIKQAVADPIR